MTTSESILALGAQLRIRVAHANKRVDELRVSLEKYENEVKACVIKEFSSAVTNYRVANLPPIYDEIFGISSEIFHHARSTLDNLIWGLVLNPDFGNMTESDRKQIYFPICFTPRDFTNFQNRVGRFFRHEHLGVLETLQPFHMGDEESELFWIRRALSDLSHFSNHDKHRNLVLINSVVDYSISVTRVDQTHYPIMFFPIHNNQIFATQAKSAASSDLDFKFTLSIQNQFTGATERLMTILEYSADAVSEEIIPMLLF